MANMEITTSIVQGKVPVSVIALKGDLDASSAAAFDAAAAKTVADGAKDILIDMSGVPFMSSAGIRSLHALYILLHPSGSEKEKDSVYKGISAGTYSAPHLKLLNPNKKVTEAIKLSGLDMYLKIYTHEKEAIEAF
jgi:anti-anti-sigma factor